jgi:magnesium-protoporphyrin IX monomethyl ester (oxidative) cyclase
MMEKARKITFINPPWLFAHHREVIMSQCLGLGYLASFLELHGHHVEIIDALALGFDARKKIKTKYQDIIQVGLEYDQIVSLITEDSDYIGISAPFTNNAKIVKQLAKEIKRKFPDLPIILGGVYPSLSPKDAFDENIDYYVVGEGELPLLDFLNGQNPKTIQGIVSFGQSADDVKYAKIIEDLDQIPFPARQKLPMEKYLSFSSPRRDLKRTASIITSRGCPFDCDFCSIHSITGYKWRMRSAENVLDEINQMINKYNIEQIEFEDDNLTLNRERIKQIVSGIMDINQKSRPISWSVPNGVRVDTLDEQLLQDIKNSNCSNINLAIESGDPEILKKMNKKLSLDKVVEVAKMCKKLGIFTSAFFMVGYPGETRQSFNKTIEFVRKLKAIGVDQFYASITRAYPGTKLYKECIVNGYMEDIKDRENLFLGNILHWENAIITPDFDTKEVLRRYKQFEKTIFPFYLRFYHKYYHIIKKFIPYSFIKLIKRIMKKEPYNNERKTKGS